MQEAQATVAEEPVTSVTSTQTETAAAPQEVVDEEPSKIDEKVDEVKPL